MIWAGRVGFSKGQEVRIVPHVTPSAVSFIQKYQSDLLNCISVDFSVALRSPVTLIFTGLRSLTAVYHKLSA